MIDAIRRAIRDVIVVKNVIFRLGFLVRPFDRFLLEF